MRTLIDLIDEHGPAIEYDLMRCGSRLRDFPDNGVSWRDLLIIVTQAQPDSAVWRSMNPDWQWGTTEMLVAAAVDEIRYGHYMLLRRWGDKTVRPPKPIPRPGVTEPESETIGGKDPLPIDEMADWLGGPFAALNN